MKDNDEQETSQVDHSRQVRGREKAPPVAQWFKTIGDDDIFEPLKNIYIIPSLYRYDVI